MPSSTEDRGEEAAADRAGTRGERIAVAWAFAWYFLIFVGYYVLRPVRDALVADGKGSLRWPFLAVFLVMLAAVPLYAALVARVPRRFIVPTIYAFFASHLVIFWLLLGTSEGESAWLARVFFVWINVYNLFIISLFWSTLADLFTPEQGKRLFAFATAGGTAGALVGSEATQWLAAVEDTRQLLWIPIGSLGLSVLTAWRLRLTVARLALSPTAGRRGERPTGGGLFVGLRRVVASRYLLGICGYVAFTSLCGTVMYSQQREIVGEALPLVQDRTAYFAKINLYVNLAALGFEFFLTSRLLRVLGVGWTLALLPASYVLSFALLGARLAGYLEALPLLGVLLVTQVLLRSLVYGVTHPAREVLFTAVSREDKYKSKSVIDTVVYRGADSLAAFFFDALRALLQLPGVSTVMLPLAGLWCFLATGLGRSQGKRARSLTLIDPSLSDSSDS